MIRTVRHILGVPFAAALLGGLVWAPSVPAATGNCFYKGTMFSEGSMSCQTGAQFRCKDGDWKATGSGCTDSPAVASRRCDYAGISYATGSASCQNGTQFQCEDGAWRSLGLACTVGDSPIKAVPSGSTCMFSDATVSHNSTICKAGTTMLCNNGEWVNLGTQCR